MNGKYTAVTAAAALVLMGTLCRAETGLIAKRYNDLAITEALLAPVSNLLSSAASEESVLKGLLYVPSLGENYALSWTGYIWAPESGDYTFGTKSDDGSAICMDLDGDGDFDGEGELIVNNNAFQGEVEKTGTVFLEASKQYPIAIGYYQGTGGALMEARFGAGTQIAYGELPVMDTSSVFFMTEPGTACSIAGADVSRDSGTSAVLRGILSTDDPGKAGVIFYYGASDGGTNAAEWAESAELAAPQEGGVKELPVSDLVPDSVYYYRMCAQSEDGVSWADESGAFITGAVSMELVNDASESGREPGVVRFSRPEPAAGCDLTVYYKVSGTAVAGVNYEELSGEVFMAAGQTSVEVEIVPLADWETLTDTQVVLELSAGAYVAPAGSVSVNIANMDLPYEEGVNIWMGSGSASDAANWSLGRIPVATDVIRLGEFSPDNMVWDAPNNGLPTEVAGWIQEEGYTGTVEIPTTYELQSTVFTQMVVKGDVRIEGGVLSHPAQTEGYKAIYRLCVRIEGDLNVGSSGNIDVSGKGYKGGDDGGPGSVWKPHGDPSVAAHGGFSGFNAGNGQSTNVYGSVFAPRLPGSRGQAYEGGGAIWINVSGNVTVDGGIRADGAHTKWGAGSGGSVYLSCSSMSGTGYIVADGGQGVNPYNEAEGWGPSGGAGRVSVVLRSGDSTGSVRIFARGGSKWSDDRKGGPGTVYIQLGSQNPGRGTIVVDNDWRSWDERIRAALPGTVKGEYAGEIATPEEDFSGSALVLRNCAFLSITKSMKIGSIDVDGNSRLYLGGHNVKTDFMMHNGVKVEPGTYVEGDLDRVKGEGTLMVLPTCTMLMLK